MIGREYLSLQAKTLLKLAKITSNPKTAAGLATKAAELQGRYEDAPTVPDASPAPPNIQPDK